MVKLLIPYGAFVGVALLGATIPSIPAFAADEIVLRPGAAPAVPDTPSESAVLRGTRPANPVPSQPAGEGIDTPSSASAPGSGCPFGYDCSGKDSDFDRSGLNPRY